jgi:hypothetical protein
MPSTYIGWFVLIVVALVFFVGWSQAGADVHSWITGIETFAHAVSGH